MRYDLEPMETYLKAQALCFDLDRYQRAIYPCISPHMHSMLELIYLTEGAMTVESENGTYVARAGELLVFSPYEPHSAHIDRQLPSVQYVYAILELQAFREGVFFEPNTLIEDLLSKRVRVNERIAAGEAAERIGACVCEMARCYGQRSQCASGLLAHASAALALGLLVQGGYLQTAPKHSGTDSAFVADLLSFVEANYMREIFPDDPATALAYSRSHFCRLMRRNFKQSFFAFLRDYRIAKALELLNADPARKISEIALAVGFSDYCYFTHAFKELLGITPREYRRDRRGDL